MKVERKWIMEKVEIINMVGEVGEKMDEKMRGMFRLMNLERLGKEGCLEMVENLMMESVRELIEEKGG